jgi:hypothetical protein
MLLDGVLARVKSLGGSATSGSWTQTSFQGLPWYTQIANAEIKMGGTVSSIAGSLVNGSLQGGGISFNNRGSGPYMDAMLPAVVYPNSTGQSDLGSYSDDGGDANRVATANRRTPQTNSYGTDLWIATSQDFFTGSHGVLFDAPPPNATKAYAVILNFGHYRALVSNNAGTANVTFIRNGGHFIVISGYLTYQGTPWLVIHDPWTLDQNGNPLQQQRKFYQVQSFTNQAGTISYGKGVLGTVKDGKLSPTNSVLFTSPGFGYLATISATDPNPHDWTGYSTYGGTSLTSSYVPSTNDYYAIIEGYTRISAPIK